MKVDTLFLSGCGSKIGGYVGVFTALLEKKIIDLDKIERYVCCSAGAIVSLNLCCGLSMNVMRSYSDKTDYTKLYDLEDLDDLFENHGLFSNRKVGNIASAVLMYKFKKRDMSLSEFYEKTNKHFICKVFNLTKKKEEYICYKTNPDLSIIKLICMTTCIPVFFKPILYNDNYYIDGGMSGSMPFIDKYKNFIGIYICSECNNDIKNMDTFEYLLYLLHIKAESYKFTMDDKRFIKITCLKDMVANFDISMETKNIIVNTGYKLTIDHINKYLIDK